MNVDFPESSRSDRDFYANQFEMELDIIKSFEKILQQELKDLEPKQEKRHNISKRKIHFSRYRNSA